MSLAFCFRVGFFFSILISLAFDPLFCMYLASLFCSRVAGRLHHPPCLLVFMLVWCFDHVVCSHHVLPPCSWSHCLLTHTSIRSLFMCLLFHLSCSAFFAVTCGESPNCLFIVVSCRSCVAIVSPIADCRFQTILGLGSAHI